MSGKEIPLRRRQLKTKKRRGLAPREGRKAKKAAGRQREGSREAESSRKDRQKSKSQIKSLTVRLSVCPSHFPFYELSDGRTDTVTYRVMYTAHMAIGLACLPKVC